MKNPITQFSLVIIAFVGLTLLLGYTRPAAEEAKAYMVVIDDGSYVSNTQKFEAKVNQKLAEGWHLQGGVSTSNGFHLQAMVK